MHYMSRGSADGVFPPMARAAIITDVCEDISKREVEKSYFECRLFVMNPDGTMHTDWLSQGDQPGNWQWPPRV